MKPLILRATVTGFSGVDVVRVARAQKILDGIFEEAPRPHTARPKHGISIRTEVGWSKEEGRNTLLAQVEMRPLRRGARVVVVLGSTWLRFNVFESFKEENGDMIIPSHGTVVSFLRQHLELSGMAYTICGRRTTRMERGYKKLRTTHTVDVGVPDLSVDWEGEGT